MALGGDDDRPEINPDFLQPFLSYSTPTAWTFSLQSESSCDWDARPWLVPIHGVVSKVTRVGKLPVSVAGCVHYWAESPAGGPEGWGGRITFTLLLPRLRPSTELE